MRKLRWGVLGCSPFARRRGIPAMKRAQSVDLLAVASRNDEEKAEAFRTEFDLSRSYGSYAALLDDPDIDAVHITTANGLHAEWILRALEKGKHVLCEKPFTTNAEQAEQISKFAPHTGLQVMEGLVWRFHPQHQRAAQVIKDGAIGQVRLVRAAFTFQLQDRSMRCDPVLGGGCMFDVGCYTVSSSRFYFGSEPASVDVRGSIDPSYNVDIHSGGMMQFDGGITLMDCGFDAPYRTDLEIVGDRGRIYFPRAWQPLEEANFYINDELITLPATNQYVLMFEHFSDSVLNGTPAGYGVNDAAAQIKTIEAVVRSIRSGHPEPV